METVVYGDLKTQGLEVVARDSKLYARYDAGTHQIAWREDELTKEEFQRLKQGEAAERAVIIALQARIAAAGADPYRQNWMPHDRT